MRFSNSRRTEQQYVFPMSHKAGCCQFADLCLIEGWLKREVELIKRLDEREARQACFHGHIPFHTGAHFEHPACDPETPHTSSFLWQLPRQADRGALARASTLSVPGWLASARSGDRS